MKKLQSFAFYALATPLIAFGASSVLAQQPIQGTDRQQQSTQSDRGATQAPPLTKETDQSKRRGGQTDSETAADRRNRSDHSRTQNRGYLDSVPANGMRSSDLIGATVSTANDDDVGSVDDLIIDENGQIVAIIVGVGGFLGMGQRDVAIGWDSVTKTGSSDDLDLRIDVTPDNLRSAPKFVKN